MTAEQKQALIQRILNIKTSGKANRFEITELAEIALASLTAQPIGRVDRGSATDSNEYPDARVVCLHEHIGWEAFQDGCELFTRPAPAAGLAELVPDEVDNWKNPAAEAMRDIGYVGSKQDFTVGANWMRAAILRNIEAAK